jgi:hypothetical protein
MSVGSSGVLVGKLAMFVSRSCVPPGFLVLAERMVMLGLNMMVRGGVMMGGRREMMLRRRMLLCLCHFLTPFERKKVDPLVRRGDWRTARESNPAAA